MVAFARTLRRTGKLQSTTRKFLLGCGVGSSVLYVASDVLATLRYPGYSYTDQVFSELTAEGSPTRTLMIALNGIPYTVLVTAFGIGVWTSAARQRASRLTAAMLSGYAISGMAGGVFFPMPTRGTEGSLRNTMHIPATGLMSLFVMLAMGFGAGLFGKRFRYYTHTTIVTLLAFGALTSMQGGRIANNQPTPWAGTEERVNIYATLLWIATLAFGLLRADGAAFRQQPGKSTISLKQLRKIAH